MGPTAYTVLGAAS